MTGQCYELFGVQWISGIKKNWPFFFIMLFKFRLLNFLPCDDVVLFLFVLFVNFFLK